MTAIGNKDHSVGWYMKGEPEISKPARELLEGYSHVPPDRIIGHVSEMVCRTSFRFLAHKDADASPARPCLGCFSFPMHW